MKSIENMLDMILVDALEPKNLSNKVRIIIDGKVFKTPKGKTVWSSKGRASSALLIALKQYSIDYRISGRRYLQPSEIKEMRELLIKTGRLVYEVN